MRIQFQTTDGSIVVVSDSDIYLVGALLVHDTKYQVVMKHTGFVYDVNLHTWRQINDAMPLPKFVELKT